MSLVAVQSGRALARLAFWSASVFAFVMAVLPQPPHGPSDKVQHIAAFVTLALLGSWAYPKAGVARLLGGLSLFGAAIEAAQAIPWVHRDSDLIDWLVDTLGAGLVLLPWGWWRARRALR